MKFIDVTVDHPEIIAKMKMAQNTKIKALLIRIRLYTLNKNNNATNLNGGFLFYVGIIT
ncbi:hypothetical protein P9E69_16480 [Bacillus licheniformis]|uniref:hypothetical protein n=1 Tax=Bacillus licheniformis TaxID=1402 RepID=UPI002DBD7843|nr:hypothetical protein [Bacillus licheniformis]MEC1812681.1 hypothetical protein [Bacillus licheniformis]